MATRYRDLQRPSLVDTTPLETGNSEAAGRLARAFKEFEGIALEPLAKMRAQQGQEEGAAAGSAGTPEFRAGLRAQTAYGAAYNNAALRSYAVKMEGDADEHAARLEVEAANDPGEFNTLFGAVRDESIKQAPKEARAALSEIYATRLNTGVARLTRARAVEQNNLARADTTEGVERSVDRIANLSAQDDPVSYEKAAEEEAKLTLMIDGAVNDGTFTAVEGQALRKNAQRAVTAQTVSARFQQQLTSPYGNPVEFIEKLKAENVKSEALSPTEEAALVDKLMGDLRQHNTLMSAKYSEDNALVAARYETGEREATVELLNRTLTIDKISMMVRQERLRPAVGRTMMNELQSAGGKIFDDPKESFHVRTNLITLTDEEITNNRKLSYETRADLLLKKRELEQTWRGTQAAQEGQKRIERSLGIVAGTNRAMLSDEENEALDNALTAWYNEVDALPAGERQAAVIRIAEETAGTYIRKNKSVQAQEGRRNLESYIQRAGDPAKMDKEERKMYDNEIMRRNKNIEALEAEAARK